MDVIRVDTPTVAESPIMSTVAMELSRSQRLDRLPLTATHLKAGAARSKPAGER
jgi:hypothetical protein